MTCQFSKAKRTGVSHPTDFAVLDPCGFRNFTFCGYELRNPGITRNETRIVPAHGPPVRQRTTDMAEPAAFLS
jgi:hypothetical protein